jgi:uncharacterized protein
MKNIRTKYGSYALITGASSGIGEEFARRLASEKYNLILVARRLERLEKLAAELSSAIGIDVISVQLDLSEDSFIEKLKPIIDKKEIGILVNNAGSGSTGEFIKADPDYETKMVKLNCVAPTILTHYILRQMVERKNGAIIFLGSVVAFQPTPFMATYAATKVFNQFLGNALWWELKKQNIDVLVINPGGTETEFQRIADAETGPIPRTPKNVVDTALDALGKKPNAVDGFFNKLLSVSSRFTSKKFIISASGRMTSKLYSKKGKT